MRTLIRIILLITAMPAHAADFAARVVGITDGDTLTVLTPGKQRVKIQLRGIDAPESHQDFGSRAKQAASEFAFGKDVTIQPAVTDRYGRTVAEVILPDGRSMNREMVRLGIAWWYRHFAPDNRALTQLKDEARVARHGLRCQPHPVLPWEWRKGDPHESWSPTAGAVSIMRRDAAKGRTSARRIVTSSRKRRVR